MDLLGRALGCRVYKAHRCDGFGLLYLSDAVLQVARMILDLPPAVVSVRVENVNLLWVPSVPRGLACNH